MFDFMGTIFSKVISVIASGIIAVGIVSMPTPIPEPISEPTVVAQSSGLSQEQLAKLISESEKQNTASAIVAVADVESEAIQEVVSVISTPVPTPIPTAFAKSKPILVSTPVLTPVPKTFTTPNGAVVDETGNVISGPTKIAPFMTNINIVGGGRVLSGEEIYSLISPSVVFIESSGGTGTGFVIEGGKYTITNAHVVGSDSKVTLKFQNSDVVVSASVLGKNDSFDVALIYNNNSNYLPVTFGSMKIGADVYALGFPLSTTFGLSAITFTRGMFSARQNLDGYPGTLLQTDAAINSGNSGGPLVNNRGEVVGMNTFRLNDDSTQGIYFAIPIETAKSLIPSLSQYGKSRMELYPIGSSYTVNRSFVWKIGFNNHLSCSQVVAINNFTDRDLELCELYKKYKDDYHWDIVEDMEW